VTAVEFSADGSQVFAGGLENEIKIWDLRKEEVSLTLKGHTGPYIYIDVNIFIHIYAYVYMQI